MVLSDVKLYACISKLPCLWCNLISERGMKNAAMQGSVLEMSADCKPSLPAQINLKAASYLPLLPVVVHIYLSQYRCSLQIPFPPLMHRHCRMLSLINHFHFHVKLFMTESDKSDLSQIPSWSIASILSSWWQDQTFPPPSTPSQIVRNHAQNQNKKKVEGKERSTWEKV